MWVDTESFSQPGLYLRFPDGSRLDLTEAYIHETALLFLGNPELLPPRIKTAAEFQPCLICPKRDTSEHCHAIMAFLPFVEEVDRLISQEKVTAVYRAPDSAVLEIADTTLGDALVFLGILSLTFYCEVGQKYGKYFKGISPLISGEEMGRRVFQNLFCEANGNLKTVRKILDQMKGELLVTTTCQMGRLRLICKNEAFLNAVTAVYATAVWMDFAFQQLQEQELERPF